MNFPGLGLGNPVNNFNVPADIGRQSMQGQITSTSLQNNFGKTALSLGNSIDNLIKDGLQTQDSFGRWINDIIIESPVSADDMTLGSSVSTSHQSFTSPSMGPNLSSIPEQYQIFYITDISPSWASSTEPTKVVYAEKFFLHCCFYMLPHQS